MVPHERSAFPHSSESRDPFVQLRIEYFVNPKGNVFGVIHRRGAHGDLLPELKEPDTRPYEHIKLASAALLAMEQNKLDLFPWFIALLP